MERKKVKNEDEACHQDRVYWLNTMLRIADPVLNALVNEQLKSSMPVKGAIKRDEFSYLEAFGRLVCGMAPWIETGPRTGKEGELRCHYADLMRRCIAVATDETSPDYMNFSDDFQPIVDAAFLAHAIVRAPNELYAKLPANVKENLAHALKKTRTRKPHFSNWLLFSAMIETALSMWGEDWDPMRVDFALKQHEQWYLGDGMYSDGPHFAMDYYNSFVIQPMLVDIARQLQNEYPDWATMKPRIDARARRYAVIQERSISPEGTFPVVGRSLAYRFGAFQHLAQMALQHNLGDTILPAQVRCALTCVMKRMIEMPGTFDEKGWLQIGFCGHQPEMGEAYVSTGSLYLCATIFLPLGLDRADPFWQGEAEWTSVKAWGGKEVVRDQGL